MIKDPLGSRMKEFYEGVPKTKLMRRTPVVIRIDGKAFHTFTKGFEKPFDALMMKAMQETTRFLCKNVQGCVLGYTQSDEISLVLVDYKKLNSGAWFDYEVQKMCSIAASIATMAFNKFFAQEVGRFRFNDGENFDRGTEEGLKKYNQLLTYQNAIDNGAMFDARVFNVPREEVTNYVYWRQSDATRNSIQSVGQAFFSPKELDEKTCDDIQDMLMTQKGVNWNNFPTHEKRGTCVVRTEEGWIIDAEIPIFKGEGREYVEQRIQPEE